MEMLNALKTHWPEYLIEAAGLGIFMISACAFGTLLGHPDSPVVHAIKDPFLLRIPMGIAMGLTAILIIYSPWGKRSGAHLNPALTLNFFGLKKINAHDAMFYIGAQFIGGVVGVFFASLFLGNKIEDPAVNYVVTVPGSYGIAAAFAGEFVISFFMMFMVLNVSNRPSIARYTGIFAGILVATYIILEAPISGMSMNPARTIASALASMEWNGLWIYFVSPILGMLAAGQFYLSSGGRLFCAKLHHQNNQRCIFRCGFMNMKQEDLSGGKHPIASERT